MYSIKVSVLIPVYKVEKYIERCAISLFSQTIIEGIEFIFIDDASPDNSIQVLKNLLEKYPTRQKQVKIITHEKNSGSASARNTGFRHASGEYIIYCDSDDWVEPNMYEMLYQKAAETNADLVACDYWGDYSKKKIKYNQTPCCDLTTYKRLIITGKLHNSLWNKLIRKNIYNRLEFLFTDGVDLWEDVSVLCRLIYYVQKISFVRLPLYHYYQANNNSYTKQFNDRLLSNIEQASKIVIDFYKDISSDMHASEIKAIQCRAYIACVFRIQSGRIIKLNKKYSEITPSNLKSLNIPFYKRIMAILFLHNHIKCAKSLSYIFEKIKKIRR